MPAAVIPITQAQTAPTLTPAKNWGFSPNSLTFQATKLVSSDRYRELERRGQYFSCTQNDYKRYDFDGRNVKPGPWTMQQPLMGNNAAPFYVPLSHRKPCAPLRLGKQIVNAFTKIVFGEDRWPDLQCKEDESSQDFVQELARAAQLPARMIEARGKAGSQGAVGLSWYFHEGVPVVEVHDIKALHVHEWADRSRWRPKHVTKCYKHQRTVWDAEKRQVVTKEFWYRRDWTEQADIMYLEVEAKTNQEPAWQIDESHSSIHGDGRCHFVWMQNVPRADNPDGEPDYDGLYEKLDEVDTINSVVCRGGKLNLDPTLLLKVEAEAVGGVMVKKGSDNALAVGTTGDASYMELSGTALEAGGKLVDRLRQQILDEAECVIADPDKVAAGAVASVALQMVFAPMLARRSLICTTAGDAITELLSQMLHVAQAKWKELVPQVDADGNVVETEVTNYLNLDPRVEEEDEVDEATGEKTGEVSIQITEREPGTGRHVRLEWGPAFKPNSIDVQNTVTTMSTATGGKAVISQRAAVGVVASLLNLNPEEVMKELDGDRKNDMAVNGTMFGTPGAGDTLTGPEAAKLGPDGKPMPVPVGGAADESTLDPEQEYQKGIAKETAEHPELAPELVEKLVLDHLEQNPGEYSAPAVGAPGAPGAAPTTEAPERPKLSLTSTDLGAIITVNEARAQYGFGPWPDADGDMSLAEFKVKHGQVVSGSAMADKGQDPNKPPPTPPAAFGGPPGGKPGFGKKAPSGVTTAAEPGDVEGVVPPKKTPFGK